METENHKLQNFKNVLALFSLIIASVALIVSIKSCHTAEKALKVNRPYIQVTPVQSPTSKSFFLLLDGQQNALVLQYQVRNTGNVSAKNIIIQQVQISTSAPIFGSDSIRYEAAPVISLGGNGQEVVYINIRANSTRKLDFINATDFEGIRVTMALTYGSEIDNSRKYKTVVEHLVQKSNVNLLKSETTEIN